MYIYDFTLWLYKSVSGEFEESSKVFVISPTLRRSPPPTRSSYYSIILPFFGTDSRIPEECAMFVTVTPSSGLY